MHTVHTPVVLSLLAAVLVGSTPVGGSDVTGPPGTVLIKGERVKIGLDAKVAEEMILANEQLKGTFVSETPEHTVKVDDFYLMATEVTNEQYAEFVRATGAKPPLTWGDAAISVGREAYLKAQYEARKLAREEGKPAPEKRLFDLQAWWNRNWEEAEWTVPTELASHPVCFVDYEGARSYARWAGMRLMTEYEYQAAVRGKTENTFPWGNDWDDKKYAHSVHYGLDKTLPVGSFPDGASSDGIFDLAGSVWEWTSSPFSAFPKYEPIILKVGKGKQKRRVECYAAFDANQRVSVGGCYKTPHEALRATVRRGTDRFQSADGLGFRCAATPQPGVDMATTVMASDVPSSRRPVDVDYAPNLAVAIDRWTTREGAASVPGYSVITSYDTVMFIPVESVPAPDTNKLEELSARYGVVHLGVLYTTEELVAPALAPGTYFVTFRAKGETRGSSTDSDDGEGSSAAANGFDALVDIDVDNLVFLTIDGEYAASTPRRGLEGGKLRAGSLREEMVRADPDARPSDPPVVEMDLAIFNTPIQGNATRRGFMVDLPLGLAPGTLDDSWRRP